MDWDGVLLHDLCPIGVLVLPHAHHFRNEPVPVWFEVLGEIVAYGLGVGESALELHVRVQYVQGISYYDYGFPNSHASNIRTTTGKVRFDEPHIVPYVRFSLQATRKQREVEGVVIGLCRARHNTCYLFQIIPEQRVATP